MNRKVTPQQARHINQLVTQQHLKLREVQEQFPVLSLTQIHRISVGKNWGRVTGIFHLQSKAAPEKAKG